MSTSSTSSQTVPSGQLPDNFSDLSAPLTAGQRKKRSIGRAPKARRNQALTEPDNCPDIPGQQSSDTQPDKNTTPFRGVLSGCPAFEVVWHGGMVDALGTRGGLLPQQPRTPKTEER